jgi:RNA polymerase sigma-70 factor (sigma-E family)
MPFPAAEAVTIGMTARDLDGCPRPVAGAMPGVGPAGRRPPPVSGQGADEAVEAMYQAHYRALVRAAALLVGDIATAEDVVQDSFIAMHRGWRRLRDPGKALAYLRRSVINNSRSVLRHRAVADRHLPLPAPDLPSAEESALAAAQRSSVLAALNALPAKQREVVVLRYYADMSEAQIAAALGITRGAVKSHAARARDSLRTLLGANLEPSGPRQTRGPLRPLAATGLGR